MVFMEPGGSAKRRSDRFSLLHSQGDLRRQSDRTFGADRISNGAANRQIGVGAGAVR